MAETPEHLKNLVVARVTADLSPPLSTIYLKSGISVLVGGPLSLFVCGQFGIAATSPAHHVHNHLTDNVEGIACLLLCGAIFAVLPAIILRLVSSPLQFRAITRKSVHAPLLWLFSIGGFLAYHGEQGQGVLGFLAWCVAAWAAFEGVSTILELTLRWWHRHQLRFS